MKSLIKISTALTLMLCSALASATCNETGNEILVKQTCTKIKTYSSEALTSQPILLVALHGDAPFNNPSYQYKFAKNIAQSSQNVISVGLLRPGYTDTLDRTSDGIRGKTVGDNYDDPRVLQIADVIAQLKKRHNAQKVIVAGHSGGAAITAKLVALRPKLINHAVIVSCPCNLNAWRKDMFAKSKYEGFKGDLPISSGHELVNQISPDTKITLIHGKQDTVTKPYLSHEYYTALIKANIDVQLIEIAGEHNIFLQPKVVEQVLKSIKLLNGKL